MENWFPYQRPTFVSPNFGGYISGHSTFSRAAAEVLAYMTGDEYFPGGMGEFEAPMNEFLVFEDGPSMDITLQWAKYKDASDQTSLSRIWGGIHPPADDIPGRLIGINIALDVFDLAESLFFVDEDNDGFYNYEDCDDNNADINPNIAETCDGIDNNCNDLVDDGLPVFQFFLDSDGDTYGNIDSIVQSCSFSIPTGYVSNNEDCDDTNPDINPSAMEVFDSLDNDCNNLIDDGVVATHNLDDIFELEISPNPVRQTLRVQYNYSEELIFKIVNVDGKVMLEKIVSGNDFVEMDVSELPPTLYFLQVQNSIGTQQVSKQFVKY